MKKILLAALFLVTPFITHGAIEHIEHFDADIVIDESSRISVKETIDYDFGEEERHGIFRWVPLRAVVGGVGDLKIDNILVTDESGTAYPIADISDNGGSVNIKIGDAYTLITGVHTYIISYTIDRAIGYFDNYDELYWNITGNDWEVPINRVTAKVTLPTEVQDADLILQQYCLSYGDSSLCGDLRESVVDGKIIYFESDLNRPFSSGEGVTLSVGFPKGIVAVAEIPWWENARTYTYIFIGIIAYYIISFLIWFFGIYMPKKRGMQRPIITEYTSPEGMSPSVLGYIYNNGNGSTSRFATADILYLAQKGVVGIDAGERKTSNRGKKSLIIVPALIFGLIALIISKVFLAVLIILAAFHYKKIIKTISLVLNPVPFTFTQKKEIQGYQKHLQTIYSIFTSAEPVTLEEIKNRKEYKRFDTYAGEVAQQADLEYSPLQSGVKKRFLKFFAFSFVASSIMMGVGFLSLSGKTVSGLFVCLLALVILGIVSFSIKESLRKNLRYRTDVWYKAAGLYQYIKTAEKDRIAFESNPEKSEHIFSELLPYAVVFKLEEKWTETFKGIISNPEWSTSSNGFSTAVFVSSLNLSIQSVSSSGRPTSSSSGSSGGGFSGGGGGGGGGGSW